ILELDSFKKEIFNTSEKALLELSVVLAKKIICTELRTNPQLILEIVKAAVLEVQNAYEIKIRLNPIDLDELKKIKISGLFSQLKASKSIILEEDSSLNRGGCFVESNIGEVDAGIEQQLKEIANHFKEETVEK
ncbi:MAG: FliH/SctL family protein, partial [Thermodesulfobacteriota bacterium]|nr:FliH/SctL family protein [Thermodesulfobacteriota bacterium]